MSIWSVETTLDYKGLELLHEEDADLLLQLGKGQRIASIWHPLPVQLVDTTSDLMPDFFEFSSLGLACRKKTLDIIQDLIEECVEILPLKCDEEELYILNILRIEDCLDYTKSQVERWPNGMVSRVVKLVLKFDCPKKQRYLEFQNYHSKCLCQEVLGNELKSRS